MHYRWSLVCEGPNVSHLKGNSLRSGIRMENVENLAATQRINHYFSQLIPIESSSETLEAD